jgi:hypothetical protein
LWLLLSWLRQLCSQLSWYGGGDFERHGCGAVLVRYVTAGGTDGMTGGIGGTNVGTGEGVAPSEVGEWELTELEPHSELWLLLEIEPLIKVRVSLVDLSGLELASEVRGSPVELSVLGLVAVSGMYW